MVVIAQQYPALSKSEPALYSENTGDQSRTNTRSSNLPPKQDKLKTCRAPGETGDLKCIVDLNTKPRREYALDTMLETCSDGLY